jgi:hypothetical protein
MFDFLRPKPKVYVKDFMRTLYGLAFHIYPPTEEECDEAWLTSGQVSEVGNERLVLRLEFLKGYRAMIAFSFMIASEERRFPVSVDHIRRSFGNLVTLASEDIGQHYDPEQRDAAAFWHDKHLNECLSECFVGAAGPLIDIFRSVILTDAGAVEVARNTDSFYTYVAHKVIPNHSANREQGLKAILVQGWFKARCMALSRKVNEELGRVNLVSQPLKELIAP